MNLGSSVLRKKVFRPDQADASDMLANSTAGGSVADDASGWNVSSAGAGSAHLHLGDKLFFNIDRLVDVEFLFKIDGLVDGAQTIEAGLISAYNADLAVTAEHVLLRSNTAKVAGKGYEIEAFADDGTLDLNNEKTGKYIQNGNWYRFHLGFKSAVQTISYPGDSKPGKSSIQYTITDDGSAVSRSFARKTPLMQRTAHLDMSNYAGGLQPVIGFVSTGSSVAMTVGEICVQYQQET